MAEKIATTHRRKGGVFIQSVTADSPADQCGLQRGDKLFSINGFVIPDSLSYSFHIAQPELILVVEKSDGEIWELEIENDGQAFGITLEEDPIMLCRNKCIFCFVDQNPKGYRRSLLIKDEDIRLSFMYGNYSTLSSTDAAEEERIIREKIRPLYVSVHATDPETRVFMLKNKRSGNILERLRHFAENHIDFHAQIVLCPGINDGAILEKTFLDLARLYPACKSIAVVPLGITRHRQSLTSLTPVSDTYCGEVIEACDVFRRRFQTELGYPLIFLGDEFYLRAGVPLPSRAEYLDFPQMENGIGMVRRFLDSFEELRETARIPGRTSGTLITGTLFGPILSRCIHRLNADFQTNFKVASVRNDAFGPDLINVAGLVHGKDIIAQLKGRDLGSFVLLPHVMLKDAVDDPLLIDNYRPQQLARSLGVPLVTAGNSCEEMFEVLEHWRDHVAASPLVPGLDRIAPDPPPLAV